MKKIIIYFFFLCVFQTLHSQNTQTNPQVDEDNTIYDTSIIEVQPGFPGGSSAWYSFLKNNLHHQIDLVLKVK